MAKFFKKAFTMSVVVTTIVWAAGLAAFVPTAQAASSGDLIKASGAAVYYFGADGNRYVFPNEKTYKTWFSDFSSVITVTDAELAAIPIGGNVTYRPGVKMIKITTDPKVYAVGSNGTLRWIETEAAATDLYGSNWASMVEDVPDAFFTNYTIGDSISAASQFDVAAETSSASSINVDKGIGTDTGGAVTVTVASDTPAGATLPLSANGVEMLKINLSGTGNLNTLTIKSIGVGATTDIANVYLYDGANRLTSGKTFNSTTKEATFTGSWSVPRTLTVVSDITAAATASNQHAYSVIEVNGTSVSGITGNTFTIGGQAVSNITVAETTLPSNPKVGETQAEIGEVKITGGANDAWINTITFTQIGSINTDEISNFTLKQGSTVVATAAAITDGDKIVLPFSTPFSLLSGSQKNFTLYADISGRPGRTINTYIDENSDVQITDALLGFGAGITNNVAAGDILVTTEGGDVTVAFNGPITDDVSKGAQDVVLWSGALTAVAPVEVRNTYLTIAGTAGGFVKGSAGTNYFTDIKIRNADTGATVAGPTNIPTGVANSATTTGVITLTDDFTFSDTLNIEITADLENAEDAGADQFFGEGYQVTFGNATVIFTGGSDVKYDGSNDFVAAGDIIPNTPIVGNTQTVQAASLTVGTSTYVGDSTHVKGAKGAQLVGFSLTAGDDSDIEITKFRVDPRVDTDASGDFGDDNNASTVIASATLWSLNNDGTLTKIDGPRGVDGVTGSETITFENFTFSVAAGKSELFIVAADINTTAGAGNDDGVIITIQDDANITAEDADNNTVAAADVTTGVTIDNGANAINDNDNVAGVATNAANVEATVRSVGTVSITADTSDTAYRSRLIQMGATGEKVLRVKARGTDEAFVVDKLRLTANTTPANLNSLTITYPTDASGTIFESKVGTLVAGVVDFSGINWFVTEDTDSYLTVDAAVNVDTNGALSGNNPVQVQLETQDADLDVAQNAFTKAIGQSSGTVASANAGGDADSVGNNLYARKTVITITKHATSPSGSKVPGLDTFLTFTVTNGSGDTATISNLTFKLTASDAGGNDWVCTGGSVDTNGLEVYDLDDLSTNLVTGEAVTDGTGSCAASTASDTAYYRLTFGTPLEISAGASKSFNVKADTTGASALNDDSFRIDIEDDLDGTVDLAGSGTAMQWSDGLVTNNAFKVDQLPVTGGNVIF